jgi:hypothetical protein
VKNFNWPEEVSEEHKTNIRKTLITLCENLKKARKNNNSASSIKLASETPADPWNREKCIQ